MTTASVTPGQGYYFRFRAPTRITISSDISDYQRAVPNHAVFNGYAGKADIVVFDERLLTVPKLHFGLGFDLRLTHSDIEQAQIQAESIVLEFIAVLAFCERCYIGVPEFVARYRIPDHGNELPDSRYVVLDQDYSPIETSIRPLGLERFADIHLKVHDLLDDDRRESIRRALHWAWKSMDSRDVRDRFLQLWIAIELLERELKSLFSIPEGTTNPPKCRRCETNDFSSCPNCGEEEAFSYKAGTGFAGYKRLVTECSLRRRLFDYLHKVRSKLVHSGGSEPEEVKSALIDAQEMFAKAIFTLLGMGDTRSEQLPKDLRLKTRPMIFYFDGTVQVSRVPNLSEFNLQPVAYGSYAHSFEIDSESNELINNTEVEHKFFGEFVSGRMEKKILIDSGLGIKDVWEND